MDGPGRKPLNENDLKFAENAVKSVAEFERNYGGPRFEEDIVGIVRELVRAGDQTRETMLAMQKTQQAQQETQKAMQVTQSAILAALEGKPFGDRTDGLNYRTAALERDKRRRLAFNSTMFTMAAGTFSRIIYVDFKGQIDGLWAATQHSLGMR